MGFEGWRRGGARGRVVRGGREDWMGKGDGSPLGEGGEVPFVGCGDRGSTGIDGWIFAPAQTSRRSTKVRRPAFQAISSSNRCCLFRFLERGGWETESGLSKR